MDLARPSILRVRRLPVKDGSRCVRPVCRGVKPSDVPARPRHGLAQVRIDDEVVVYDASNDTAHLLNPSAAAIWSLLDGERDATAVGAVLADRFPGADEQVRADVQAALDAFDGLGLLDDVEPTATDSAPGTSTSPDAASGGSSPDDQAGVPPVVPVLPSPLADLPAGDDARTVRSAPYDALGYRFAVNAEPDLLARIDATLAALRRTEEEAPTHEIRLVRAPQSDAPAGDGDDGTPVLLTLDGVQLRHGPLDVVTSDLLWEINNRAVSRPHDSLVFHAAVCAGPDGRAVVLAGTANAGKSTLVTGLVRDGFTYLTDEAAALAPERDEVVSYPKPIGLDPGSWPVFPDLAHLDRGLSSSRWWLDAAALGAPVAPPGSTHPVAQVAFVRYEAGAAPEVQQLRPVEAVLALAENLFNLADHGQQGLDRLARLALAVPCHRVVYGSLDDAIAQVRGLLDEP